jgi:endoglycosylceramidase
VANVFGSKERATMNVFKALVVWIGAMLLAGASAAAPPLPVQPEAPISSVGRWFVDATGRVILFHGVNDVAKSPPYYSAARGFGDDDVAFLKSEGFNALRLGIDMRGLMPEPGQLDAAYIENLATTVEDCVAGGLFVLLDFHQDGYAPKYNGNGFPNWMAIDDGLPNPPDAVFPLYYIQNPAMQRAFEHFWGNSAIPEGDGLHDYYLQALSAIASRFGDEAMVLGTEVINEPWPGGTWEPCVFDTGAGCPDLEAELLKPLYGKALKALRAVAPRQFVFVEPFVLFNFGQAPTTIPGTDPGFALSFHSYALDVAGETGVVRHGVAAAERDGAPVLMTEFGASIDPVLLNRLMAQFDARIVPWMFWSYDGEVVRDQHAPLTPDSIVSQAALDALVRPYPVATTGVPTRIAFDPETKVFDFEYDPSRAGGGHFPRRLDTLVFVPRRHYPNGYTVEATGARVTSEPCATELRLRTKRTRRPPRRVSVRITPALPGREPSCP